MPDERDWKQQFENSYAGPPSAVAARVWREVFGDEYPAGLDPYSAVSVSELERFADEVGVGAGQTIVDLGCGQGGPSLWVAMATGARLIGIDISSNALEAARERANTLGLAGRAEFLEASFEDTGLPAGNADALMSIDAILFSTDKGAAVEEFRRILADDGRLVFTSSDYHRQPVGRPPQVDDHRPLLEHAGFDVLAYDETTDWYRRTAGIADGLLANAVGLADEVGTDPESLTAELREMRATIDCMSRRVFVVARARSALAER